MQMHFVPGPKSVLCYMVSRMLELGNSNVNSLIVNSNRWKLARRSRSQRFVELRRVGRIWKNWTIGIVPAERNGIHLWVNWTTLVRREFIFLNDINDSIARRYYNFGNVTFDRR